MPLGQVVDCFIGQPVARSAPSAEVVLVGENVPTAQAVQTRSDTAVEAAAKKVPFGHVGLCCEAQVSATALPKEETVLDEEKVPAGHVEHTRSAVGVDGAEKKVPDEQLLLCTKGQALATWLCRVEAATADANVPGLQPVQARSEVEFAAAE